MKPASHPSHTLWKSLRDSHIPTASTTWIYVFSCPPQLDHSDRKGLVTDVSGPQRNACPGTLTPERGCLCEVLVLLVQLHQTHIVVADDIAVPLQTKVRSNFPIHNKSALVFLSYAPYL
jgi:hypothetical protein